jgi:hypothetical protein
MEKNPVKWTAESVTITSVNEMIVKIDAADKEVEISKQIHSQKLGEARTVSNAATTLADKLETLALGFHAGDESKLLEYSIQAKRDKQVITTPETKLTVTIVDDIDNVGFRVSTVVEPKASYYEWQKGIGLNAADINTIPEMKLFKTTKKTNFVDDDVTKGVRVFYKVRACNASGEGPWSEAVSRVQ